MNFKIREERGLPGHACAPLLRQKGQKGIVKDGGVNG